MYCFCFLVVNCSFVRKNQWRDFVYFQLNRFGRNWCNTSHIICHPAIWPVCVSRSLSTPAADTYTICCTRWPRPPSHKNSLLRPWLLRRRRTSYVELTATQNSPFSSLAMAITIASTHCAYPRRDGQAELAWVAGYVVRQSVASPASGHVGTCPLAFQIFFAIRWNKLSGLVWYYAKL